jgi:mRNA-degrading endonuclease HigB of HigAB toxin-antitoxin module
MKIFTEKPLVDFIESNPKYRIALQDWSAKVKESEWECIDDIIKEFDDVEQIDKNTLIFSLNNGKSKVKIKAIIIGQFLYVKEFLCK